MQQTLLVIRGVRIFDGIQIIPQNTVVVVNGFSIISIFRGSIALC